MSHLRLQTDFSRSYHNHIFATVNVLMAMHSCYKLIENYSLVSTTAQNMHCRDTNNKTWINLLIIQDWKLQNVKTFTKQTCHYKYMVLEHTYFILTTSHIWGWTGSKFLINVSSIPLSILNTPYHLKLYFFPLNSNFHFIFESKSHMFLNPKCRYSVIYFLCLMQIEVNQFSIIVKKIIVRSKF